MANENENIQPAGENHEEKHKSWLGSLIDKVQDLDTDFPLSGGEEDPRPPRHHAESKPAENADGNEKPEHHESFLHHLAEEIKHKINNIDTDFPLSGGEE